MADFNFYINRQGIQGRKGDKGETGFSPAISVGTDTPNEYKLIIANESNSFETPNLRGNINVLDNGGTYLRYDAETQQISAQGLDAATSTNVGGVLMSTDTDIQGMGDSTVVTPANVADALPVYLQGEGAVTITQDEVTSKTKINVDLSSVTSDIDSLKARTTTAENEIVGIQADIANLDADNTNNKAIIDAHTNSIASINDSISSLQANKQNKLTAGEGITIDSNNVISSTGGGGAGDVTAAGDNTFTGSNNFTKQVNLGNGAILNDYIPIEFGTRISSGSQVVNRGTIQNELTEFTKTYPSGYESYLLANTLKINGGYNLILDAGSIKDQDLMTLEDYTYKGKILDGEGNVILSQGNVTAGKGVTINKTEKGIEIVVDNSGGGSTPSNMVTTDTEQTITANKTISNGNQIKFYKETGSSNNGALYSATNGNFVVECQNTTGNVPESIILGEQGIGAAYHRRGIFLSHPTDEAVYVGNTNYACKIEGKNDLKLWGGHAQNSYLTLSNDSMTYTKSDGTSVDLLAGGGGGGNAPENMVTTNTDQYINSYKTFNYDTSVTNAASNAVELGNNGIRFRTFTSGYEHQIEGFDYTNGSLYFGGFGGGIKFGNSIYDKNGNEILGGGGSTNIRSSDTSITATTSDAGVDLAGNKAVVTGYSFPSNRYVELTLGATGAAYTAPANGWYVLHKTSGAAGEYLILTDSSNKMRSDAWSSGGDQYTAIFLPVRKGEEVNAYYTFSGKTTTFRFVYAFGAESEAQ